MVGTERPALRVFADNGRWWLLNMDDTELGEVVVGRRDGDNLVRIEGLCAERLSSAEQRAVVVGGVETRDAHVTLEVSWTDRQGRAGSYRVRLPADGMKRPDAS